MIHRIVVGHMLGDGHIAKVQKGNSYFSIHRKAEHHEYNLWSKKMLLDNDIVVTDTYPKVRQSCGKSFPASFLRTGRDKFWSKQRALWYKGGKKVLPKEYIEENFNDLSFLLWFLDDGDCQRRISTDSFSSKDVIFLRDLIRNKYGIRFSIRHQSNRPQHNILFCPKNNKDKLLAIFQSSGVLIPCMLYKLNWR